MYPAQIGWSERDHSPTRTGHVPEEQGNPVSGIRLLSLKPTSSERIYRVIRMRGPSLGSKDGLSNAKPMLFGREVMDFAALSPSYVLYDRPAAALCGKRQLRHRAAEGFGVFGQGAGEEIAAAALGAEFSPFDDDPAARDDRDRPALQPHSLIRRVADVVVNVGGAHRHFLRGVPDRDIGIRADRDRAFFRIE